MKKRVQRKHERAARHAAADKRPKTLQVFVCCECLKLVNGRDAYRTEPATGKASSKAWCTECYEREVSRATQARMREPRPAEQVA